MSVAWKILFISPTTFLLLLIPGSAFSPTASCHSLPSPASVSADLTSSFLILFASRIAVTCCTNVRSIIFLLNVTCYSESMFLPCTLYSIISGHLKSMCGPVQPQHIRVFLFWPCCRPSFCIESVPERLRDSDRFLVWSTVGIVRFGCVVSCWSSGFELSNRGYAAKAAQVIFPLPAIFMLFQIDFCSQDCQSSLVALYISHSASSPSFKASVSWSQSRFAPGTFPQTRLKSLAQLLCSAGHQTLHSTISLCHSVNHFLGPIDGHSMYSEPSRVRCRAQIRSVI